MSIDGWYYLHTNGSLIYKRELGDTVADLRESDFVRAVWPLDTQNRESAWEVLICALASGVDIARIASLAEKWQCDDTDAAIYSEQVGARIFRDGDQWCATRSDFVDLQNSPAGFGATALVALSQLARELGYRPQKMWGVTFRQLLTAPVPACHGANDNQTLPE